MSTPKQTGLARGATRNINRAEVVDRAFTDFVSGWTAAAVRKPRPSDPVRRSAPPTAPDRISTSPITSGVHTNLSVCRSARD